MPATPTERVDEEGLMLEWLPFEDVVRYQEKIMGNSTSTKANGVPSSEHHTPLLTAFFADKPGMWREWRDIDFCQLENLAKQLERDRAELLRACNMALVGYTALMEDSPSKDDENFIGYTFMADNLRHAIQKVRGE